MEGLVKGLISVALGQGEEDEGNRDERSRSTWAQVVSGEQDDHDKSSSSNDRHSGHGYNRQEEERNDGWRSGESRPTMRPQKAVHQEYYRDADRRQDNYNQVNWNRKEEKQADDGWATVGNRPVKQHYKFYLEEAKGRVDYQGYILPRRRGLIPDTETQLLTVQFEWNGVLKSVSSTLIGVSPEFEVAIYTLCFYLGREDNHVELGPYSVNIKCYRLGNKIGSAFTS